MGLCYAATGRHREAAESLLKAADIQPLSPYPFYHLGMAYHMLGDRKRVDKVIAQLKVFDPKVTRKLIEDTTAPQSAEAQ
jgi:tetratricopeptide (TPR) repeat protein